jgi:hypothetical protein
MLSLRAGPFSYYPGRFLPLSNYVVSISALPLSNCNNETRLGRYVVSVFIRSAGSHLTLHEIRSIRLDAMKWRDLAPILRDKMMKYCSSVS